MERMISEESGISPTRELGKYREVVLGACMERFFEKVWKVVAPERVKVFLWLVAHQVILTNEERVRRRMGDSAVCPVCRGATESIIHVLRDCPTMAEIWIRLVPRSKRGGFFTKSVSEWLFENLSRRTARWGDHWPTLFAVAVWWGWKWRCGNVFGETGKCRDRVQFIKNVVGEVTKAHSLGRGSSGLREREERLIAWKKPTMG